MTSNTPITESLTVELSLSVFYDLGLSRLGLEYQLSACGANALTHCATIAVSNGQLQV